MRYPNPKEIVLVSSNAHLVPDAEETCTRAGIQIRGIIARPDGGDIVLAQELVRPVAELADLLIDVPVLSLAFGPGKRQQVYNWLSEQLGGTDKYFVTGLTDPTSIIPASTQFGRGTFVNSGCVFGAASTFGDNCLINRGCVLGHHLKVADYVSFGPAASVMGDVSIGKGAMIGMNATVFTDLTIGENAVVGAGAVVMEHVAAKTVVVGNPAKVVRENAPGYQGITVV